MAEEMLSPPVRRASPPSGPIAREPSFLRLGWVDRVAQESATRHAGLAPRQAGGRFNPRPATGDPDYSDEECAVLKAIDAWRTHTRQPATHLDVFRIVKGMGYALGYAVVPHGYKIVRDDDVALAPPRLRAVSPD